MSELSHSKSERAVSHHETSDPALGPPSPANATTYLRFLARLVQGAFDGTWRFYVWMFVLTAVALVGAHGWAAQTARGMGLTGMSDHVSWGLYIANFTFVVGLAAGGVMMLIPAYLYRDEDMHDVTIIGELLAIAAIVMALLFVVVDLGRPDRFWHLLPFIGRFHWPVSMLTWDVLVLNGYLVLNLHVVGYLLYQRFLGRVPERRWYVPFVFLSIVWAFSIHTVTAFLYSGLGGRPFWNTALLAPRFLASAFVTGPAFIVLLLQLVPRFTTFRVPERAVSLLLSIVRVTMLVNLFMLGSELFTLFYGGGAHAASARYLFFGSHGHYELVPWIWTAVALNVSAAVVLHVPALHRHRALLNAALVGTFVGVWIEKGMGLIVPGFIPSTLHELVPYAPSRTEWQVTAGIWAFGFMVLTLALKLGLRVFTGELHMDTTPESATLASTDTAVKEVA